MVRDKQSITRDWQAVDQPLLDGVTVVEVKNVMSNRGFLTEIYRDDWQVDTAGVAQVFQTVLEPGAVSAWHAHGETTDRLFVSLGQMLIVLYDARRDSPSHGRLNQFRFGSVRPALVTVPVGVWHGVQNIASAPSVLLNLVSHAYSYEHPDHYRLPMDSAEIPFRFNSGTGDTFRHADANSPGNPLTNRKP
jgi:dTDP-4-dehydrorhamnose 3,5-epimerase